jgi:hypothetical protein
LPRLPAEAQSWINGLSLTFRRATENVLNIVGTDSFIRNWQVHQFDGLFPQLPPMPKPAWEDHRN